MGILQQTANAPPCDISMEGLIWMSLPRISIVTPSFNQAEFLDETIRSVLNQNYADLEYVIIDGGSSDDSQNIISKYADRLHYWVSERDGGHGQAINKGFSHTTGEIMAWINSDDKYTPWSLEVVAGIFSQFPHVNWIVGFNAWWNRQGAMTSASRVQKNIYDFLLGNYAWIQQESVFWRRSLWEKAGGYVDEEYTFMIDGELWTRFFLCDELYSLDCILGGYRSHSQNRAKQNVAQCHQEMNRAINVMRHKCANNVLDTYRKFECIRKLKYIPFFDKAKISRLGRKFFCPGAFETASYKNIAYKDEMWAERALPFWL